MDWFRGDVLVLEEVVFIDDEEEILDIFKEIFSAAEYKTKYFEDPSGARDYILNEGGRIFAVVSDLKMPLLNGFDLIQTYYKKFPHIDNYIATAFWNEVPPNLEEFNITQVLRKPVNLIEIKKMLTDLYKTKCS